MASKVSLKALITSLVRAFSTAQNALSWEQLRALSVYRHKDGTLKKFVLEVPAESENQKHSSEADGDGNEDAGKVYEAPLLGLIPPHPLTIESATMKLAVNITDIDVSELTETPAEEFYDDPFGRDFTGNEAEESRPVFDIEVDTAGGNERAGRLEISMKIRSAMKPQSRISDTC